MFPILKSGLIWKRVIHEFATDVNNRPLVNWGFTAKGTTVVFSDDGCVQIATETRPGLLNLRLLVFGNAGSVSQKSK